MVVVYRTSAASFATAKLLVRVPWISLVNIVAGEELVPELLQRDVQPERLAREGRTLLESALARERMRAGLARVARELGPPGASERAARAVLETLESSEDSRPRALDSRLNP